MGNNKNMFSTNYHSLDERLPKDKYGIASVMYSKTAAGEDVTVVRLDSESIGVKIFQNNGWEVEYIYHKDDPFNPEEIIGKRWKTEEKQ